MHVPLLDLKLQYHTLRDEIRHKLDEITESQMFILGAEVEALEQEICRYTGANHAIGVSSGTDALLLILMALGIEPGDSVVTTPYTFFATAGGIARLGARPVFVDRKCLESDIDGKIKAIMPVHLFGVLAEMKEIMALADGYNLPVIEDAAQALGAVSPNGDHAGAIGEFGYYSFFPSKNLGAFGDAGMVVCQDKSMADKMRALRNHGMEERYYHRMIGGNFRLDAIQAAVLRVKLPHLDRWSAARRSNAAFYRSEFARTKLDQILTLPAEPYANSGQENHHIYNQFVIRAPDRDALCAHLQKHQIGHAIYYPVPLHRQECFDYLGCNEGAFPESERAARETVALPIFPELTRDQISCVVETIRSFYQ
jgi:dTDP-4-amino-4,6-dideoxygalactose transaminase